MQRQHATTGGMLARAAGMALAAGLVGAGAPLALAIATFVASLHVGRVLDIAGE